MNVEDLTLVISYPLPDFEYSEIIKGGKVTAVLNDADKTSLTVTNVEVVDDEINEKDLEAFGDRCVNAYSNFVVENAKYKLKDE